MTSVMNSDVYTVELEGCEPSKLEAGLVSETAVENVVDWDGANDPQNPLNVGKTVQTTIIFYGLITCYECADLQ